MTVRIKTEPVGVDTSGLGETFPEFLKRKLYPIKTFWEVDDLPTATNLIDMSFHIDPRKPFDVLPVTDATREDNTTIEYLDPELLAVKQIGADGEPQVVVLTPAQVVYLMHKAGNVIMLPGGGPLVSTN